MTTQGQCPLCKGTHRLYQCKKFIDKLSTQHLECVKQLRACFYCLQLYSKTHTCSSNACRTCNQRHTLLHTAMQTQSADRQGSTNIYNVSSTAKQNVTPVTNNSANEAQTHRSFKNKFNQYVPCRVLLECAAQVNFTTQWCEEVGCTKPHNDDRKKFHTTV